MGKPEKFNIWYSDKVRNASSSVIDDLIDFKFGEADSSMQFENAKRDAVNAIQSFRANENQRLTQSKDDIYNIVLPALYRFARVCIDNPGLMEATRAEYGIVPSQTKNPYHLPIKLVMATVGEAVSRQRMTQYAQCCFVFQTRNVQIRDFAVFAKEEAEFDGKTWCGIEKLVKMYGEDSERTSSSKGKPRGLKPSKPQSLAVSQTRMQVGERSESDMISDDIANYKVSLIDIRTGASVYDCVLPAMILKMLELRNDNAR